MLLESHLWVTGTTKQNGKPPFHSCPMSYTTASTLIQTRYNPLPTQGSPSFAALALLSTSTATKIVLWLRFGHRAALVATTEKNQKRSDSESSFSLGPALPVACTQMMRGTRPMGSPVTIRCRQAPGQHHSSRGWNRNIGNTALPRHQAGLKHTSGSPGKSTGRTQGSLSHKSALEPWHVVANQML